MDRSVHPPIVSRLHYVFDGWLGDDLLESFPAYIVTDRAREMIAGLGATGCEFGVVEVSKSSAFEELYPGRALPNFTWLRITGKPCQDDFGISDDYRLVVSEKIMNGLKSLQITNCDVDSY